MDYYDVVWAFSIVYAFSFPIYDGEKYQHVISPTFLLMKHDPLAEVLFYSLFLILNPILTYTDHLIIDQADTFRIFK